MEWFAQREPSTALLSEGFGPAHTPGGGVEAPEGGATVAAGRKKPKDKGEFAQLGNGEQAPGSGEPGIIIGVPL